jgi:hypothetical protein
LKIQKLWTLYNEACASIYREFTVTVVIGHDHGYPMIMAVFPLHHRPNVVVWGGFPPVPCQSWWWGIRYPLSRRTFVQSFSSSGYLFWRGRRPCMLTPSHIFPVKFLFLNYTGWKIESSYYWVYIIYFWAFVHFTHIFRCYWTLHDITFRIVYISKYRNG